MAADKTYSPKVYKKDGGDTLVVASGGVQNIEAGGAFQVAGVDITASLAALPPAPNYAVGVASGYKIARGVVAVTAAHSGVETVVTGLATVVAVVATMADDPTTTAESVTATIGDQAGTPAAGSIIVKGWKTLGGTPVASTTTSFNANWIAIGT